MFIRALAGSNVLCEAQASSVSLPSQLSTDSFSLSDNEKKNEKAALQSTLIVCEQWNRCLLRPQLKT